MRYISDDKELRKNIDLYKYKKSGRGFKNILL